MSASSRSPDRFATTVDHEGLVANAGLILAGTLMDRLGVSALIERWVRTGSANPGPKICTVVAAMLAGGTHIDHVGMLRAGRTGRVLGFRPMAPSTVGTFLRTFTFGHVRQLEAVLSRTLARASWQLGAGPGRAPLTVDLDSTICEVHGKQKQGAAYGLHQRARLSPAARCTRRHRRGARRPHAQRLRGVVARRGALRRRARREPATSRGCWADHGARRLGILVTQTDRPPRRPQHQMVDHRRPQIRCSRSDPSNRRHRLGRHRLHQQAATPKSPRRPMPPAAAKPSAPFVSSCAAPASPRAHSNDCGPTGDTTHSTPTPNTTPPPRTSSTAPTPSSSSPSATSKKAPDSNTSPQATTARTAHRSPAPCSPTTSATGPPPLPARRRPRTAPAAPDSSPSPPCSPTDPAHPPCDTPPAGPGNHNSQPHSALSGLCPDPPADPTPPGTDAPTQTQRRQPQTTPAPLAQHAQTHQTTPPTTRRDPNPPPTREPHAHQRPIGGFRLRGQRRIGYWRICRVTHS